MRNKSCSVGDEVEKQGEERQGELTATAAQEAKVTVEQREEAE